MLAIPEPLNYLKHYKIKWEENVSGAVFWAIYWLPKLHIWIDFWNFMSCFLGAFRKIVGNSYICAWKKIKNFNSFIINRTKIKVWMELPHYIGSSYSLAYCTVDSGFNTYIPKCHVWGGVLPHMTHLHFHAMYYTCPIQSASCKLMTADTCKFRSSSF